MDLNFEPISRDMARASGSKFFNDGVPCAKGHTSGRYVSNATCVDCTKEVMKKRYESKREVLLDKQKRYYSENSGSRKGYAKDYRESRKEEIAVKQKIFYRDNKEALLAYQKEYNRENADYIKERALSYRERHKDHLSDLSRKWKDKNRASVRRMEAARKVRNKLRRVTWGADIESATREVELCLHGMAIQLEAKTGVAYDVDHMYPLNGKLVCGLHVHNNLQVIPRGLNIEKRNKFLLTEANEWVHATGCRSIMEEPSWCREAEGFYRSLGWSFTKKAYLSGPYATNV